MENQKKSDSEKPGEVKTWTTLQIAIIVIGIIVFYLIATNISFSHDESKEDPSVVIPTNDGSAVVDTGVGAISTHNNGDVSYTYYSNGDEDHFLSNAYVTIPEKYSASQLMKIASELKQKKWNSEHLEISFRIKGDSLTKVANYARATYYPEETRKLLPLPQRDLNNIPVRLDIDKFYDSDSTIYYRTHPELDNTNANYTKLNSLIKTLANRYHLPADSISLQTHNLLSLMKDKGIDDTMLEVLQQMKIMGKHDGVKYSEALALYGVSKINQ